MPIVTRKMTVGKINSERGQEAVEYAEAIEAVYKVPILAEFSPAVDITTLELARAVVVLTTNSFGSNHAVFTDEEWRGSGTAQRHWVRRDHFIASGCETVTIEPEEEEQARCARCGKPLHWGHICSDKTEEEAADG